MAFLPDNYKEPAKPSNYMKLVEGENTFRVLSDAVVGYEYWVDDTNKEGKAIRRPVRVREDESVPVEFADETKFFWAFVVFNVEMSKIQILEITQAKIRKGLKAIIDNKKWGDPTKYDITVNKVKTGPDPKDVEYQVTPNPKEELPAEIAQLYKDMNVNLDALFTGQDPFSTEPPMNEPINPDDIPF